MFTGIVEGMGLVEKAVRNPPGLRLVVRAPSAEWQPQPGASIAVSGCCLTVVERENTCLTFELGPETLAKTRLGGVSPGERVNLERSLRVGDEIGGHWVTGHVDGLGQLERRQDEGDWSLFWFRMPMELGHQMAPKGSVAVEGVSLTLVDVSDDHFSVALIPHTLAVTTLGDLREGDAVNLETDILAKYVARQLAGPFRYGRGISAS
jgi:riboflavin synthase